MEKEYTCTVTEGDHEKEFKIFIEGNISSSIINICPGCCCDTCAVAKATVTTVKKENDEQIDEGV